MDIKIAIRVIKALPAHVSVLLRAGHGLGKSELIKQLAKDMDLELFDRRISTMTEGDLIGLPMLTDDVTKFMPPDFIKTACQRPVALFFDEINRGTPEVIAACFQLVLDRQMGANHLHPDTRVFAAVNTGGNYQVNEMDPALIDRFFVIDLTPSDQDFFEHAESRPAELGGPIDADLLRFLKERPSRLDPAAANPGSVQPSRRSWVRLDSTYRANDVYAKDLDKDVGAKGFAYSLAVGFVGLEAASDLVDFLAKRETRFNADHVMDAYPTHREKIKALGQDKLNTLIDMIVVHAQNNQWTPEQSANLGLFVGDVPAELRISFITNFTKGLRNHANFTPNFRVVNPTVMPHIVYAFNPNAVINGKPPPARTAQQAAASTTSAPAETKKSKKGK